MGFWDYAAPIGGFLVGGPVGAEVGDQLAGGKATAAIGGAASDAVNGVVNLGTNNNQYTPPQVSAPQFGGYDNGAADYADVGFRGMNAANGTSGVLQGNAAGAYNQMMQGPGQASEDQGLSDAFARAQGYDQAGSMSLDRDAAMGMSPSQAAYMMQAGLDQGLSNQQAIAGGARGAAGLALAGTNMAANSANMQNQAYNQAGQLRAQEMAQARGQYSGDTNNLVGQNLGRLQTGNSMALGNAGLYNGYNLGVGGVGASYGNTGLGYGNLGGNYYGQAPIGYQGNQTAGTQTNAQNIGATTGTQDLNAGITQKNVDERASNVRGIANTVLGAAQAKMGS